MLTLCFLGVLTLIGISGTGIYLNVRHNQKASSVSQAFLDYFSAQNQDGYTPFDQSLNNLSESIARKQATIIVATMRGQTGGAVRAAESGLEAEAIENIPEAAIIKALPKKIQKNPLAQMGLAHVLQKLLSGGTGSSGQRPAPGAVNDNGSNPGAQVKFNF